MNILPQDPPPGRPTPEESGGLGPFWVLTPLLHTGLWVPAPPSPHRPNWSWGPSLVPILGSQHTVGEVSLGALPVGPPLQVSLCPA